MTITVTVTLESNTGIKETRQYFLETNTTDLDKNADQLKTRLLGATATASSVCVPNFAARAMGGAP